MRVPGFGAKPREVETVLLETRHPKGLLPGVFLWLKSAGLGWGTVSISPRLSQKEHREDVGPK